jgi:hypothetical protein
MYKLQLSTLSEKVQPWCHLRLGFPSKAAQQRSSQGDCVLFSALMTYAGIEEARGYIPACIAEDGRPVRSPDRIAEPDSVDAFSKDMLLGVLLWTLITRDPAPLDRLIGYVNRTGCLCEKASDRRCTLTPQMTYLTNKVAQAVGLKARLKGDWLPGWLFSALETASALVTPLGYQCHLISVKSLIRRLLGKESQLVPTILADRDSGNPWFLFLAGRHELAAQTVLSMNVQPGQGHQWAWERDSKEQAWHDSMGWDVVFLCNLLKE